MERYADRSLKDLHLWGRIYYQAMYGYGLTERRERKHALDRHQKAVSIVYKKPPPKLPALNQLTLQTHRLRYMANADYQFFGDKARELQIIETVDTPPIIKSPREIISRTSSPTQLPVLDRQRGRLRRPRVDVAVPMSRSNEDFTALTKKTILSPIIIERCPKQTMKFYATHFPLLLLTPVEKNLDISNASCLRRERIREQIRMMDQAIDELMADDTIDTELKSDTFNPMAWD